MPHHDRTSEKYLLEVAERASKNASPPGGSANLKIWEYRVAGRYSA
jgi:hypothetical protein